MFKKIAAVLALVLVAKLALGTVNPAVSKIESRKQQIEAAIGRY